MEIRPIRPEDDRLAVSRVYEESWRYAYRGITPQSWLDAIPAGRWAGSAGRDQQTSLLLLDGDSIVGTASFGPSRFADWPGWGGIVSLYLLPSHMGRGYGAALLRAAAEGLETRGFHEIFLWALEENHRARRFYERNGFAWSGDRLETSIGGRTVREVRYARTSGA